MRMAFPSGFKPVEVDLGIWKLVEFGRLAHFGGRTVLDDLPSTA
jgi:hypothetical protein